MTCRLLNFLSRALESAEREAVLGDIAESKETGVQAVSSVLGLIARRQAILWRTPWPWLTLLFISAPFGLFLGFLSVRTSDMSAIYMWLYGNNWTRGYLDSPFRDDFTSVITRVLTSYLFLAALAFVAGTLIARISQRAARVNAAVFCLLLLTGEVLSPTYYLRYFAPLRTGRDFHNNAAVFEVTFYRIILPLLVQAFVVVLPAICAMRVSLSRMRLQNIAHVSAMLLLSMGVTQAADRLPVLIPANDRKPAPAFALKDSEGKIATLTEYQGKLVVLDFWATWCHGCKEEIPWFVDFQKSYGPKQLAVIGASMDEGGWKVLKPFLDANPIPYRMVLAGGAIAAQYGIATMPDTFLIDRKGRIAAAYKGRLIDRGDLDSKIKALLTER